MVVNNWYITVQMYTDIIGDTWWPRIYFVCFWIGMVLIQLNILIAIVLEIYSSVADDLRIKNHQLNTR